MSPLFTHSSKDILKEFFFYTVSMVLILHCQYGFNLKILLYPRIKSSSLSGAVISITLLSESVFLLEMGLLVKWSTFTTYCFELCLVFFRRAFYNQGNTAVNAVIYYEDKGLLETRILFDCANLFFFVLSCGAKMTAGQDIELCPETY